MNSEAILITAIFLFLAIVIGFLDTSSSKVEKQEQNDQVEKSYQFLPQRLLLLISSLLTIVDEM